MSVIVKQSIHGTIVNYIGVMIGIFTQFYIVAKYLDPEILGLSKVVYEVAFFFSTISLFGSSSAGMRFFPYFRDEKSGGQHNGFLFYYLLFPLFGTVCCSLLLLALHHPIVSYFGTRSPLFNQHFFLVFPMMWVLAFWVWAENYANIFLRIAVPKAIREIGMRLFMLVIYLLYGFGYLSVTGLIASFVVAYACCMVLALIYALRVGGGTLRHDWHFLTPELRRNVLRYAGFVVFATLTNGIIQQMDVIMLSGMKGLYQAGVYTMVIYMAEVVNMPTRNISPISNPAAAEAMKEGDTARAQSLYQKVSLHQMLASSFLLLIIWVNLGNIFTIIPNGDLYAVGKWAILFLGLSKVLYGTLNFGNTLISYSPYYYWTLYLGVFLAAVSLASNLYFIPRYGTSGAALASLLTVMVSYAYQQYIVQRKIKTNPFSVSHLRVVIFIALLFGLNSLLPSCTEVSPWVDGLYRTSLLALVSVPLVYYLHISPLLDKYLERHLFKRK